VSNHLPPPGDERRQKVIIRTLRRKLKRTARIRNRVSVVKRAAHDLDYAAGSTTRSRLLHSARVLGLDVETGEEAAELLRVRNRKLGHAGRVATVEDLEKWLGVDRGRGIAIAYWSAYVDWIDGRTSVPWYVMPTRDANRGTASSWEGSRYRRESRPRPKRAGTTARARPTPDGAGGDVVLEAT
jgi:hypothetical protein